MTEQLPCRLHCDNCDGTFCVLVRRNGRRLCSECYQHAIDNDRRERWNRTNPTRLDFESALNAVEGKGLTYSAEVIRKYVAQLEGNANHTA